MCKRIIDIHYDRIKYHEQKFKTNHKDLNIARYHEQFFYTSKKYLIRLHNLLENDYSLIFDKKN